MSNKSAQEAQYHESANDMCYLIYYGNSRSSLEEQEGAMQVHPLAARRSVVPKSTNCRNHGRVTTPMLAGNETQNVSQLQTELKLGPICPT